ncbi:MAG: hypothetical protein GVY20_00275 [Bacteroidetes bacterium]|jgi:hypothetical protein|nr:hypothetical protein [Bacteroidota bacterium]
MKKKLSLTIEESVKNRARKYADRHDTSFSEMVENYLESVTREDTGFIAEPGSWTESMIDVAKVSPENERLSYKEIKQKEILKKHG